MMDRARRLGRRAAWVLLLLAILAVIAWTAANVAGASRLQSTLRRLEENGYAVSHAGLASPKLAASEDAAPFLKAAFALFVRAPESEFFNDIGDHPGRIRDLPPERRAEIQRWLDDNRDAFDLLSRARARPGCRFDRDFSLGFMMPLPEVTYVMPLARACQAQAALRALGGNAAGARESVQSILTLGQSFRDEPVLVEQLVRFLASNLAMHAIDLCVTEATSEEDLAAWTALLPQEGFLKGSLERAFRGELAMTAHVVQGPTKEFWDPISGVQQPCWSRLTGPLLRWDGACYLDLMARAVNASRKPYVEGRAEFERIEGIQRRSSPWVRPVCSYLLPALGRTLESVTTAEASVAVVRGGLDFERRRRKTGKYPDKVEVRDPFTGTALIYDRNAGMLRSAVSPDAHDPIEWSLRSAKK
jgi:hypothetical protein